MNTDTPLALKLAEAYEATGLRGHIEAAAELRRLHAELAESDALREKMSYILRRTATALKGEPDDDELTLHSWHDLPEVAMTLRCEVDAIAAIKEERDALQSENAELWADAERYWWLAKHGRSTSEHWGGRWSIVIDGPCPKSHNSEDDFDAAIDAARGAK